MCGRDVDEGGEEAKQQPRGYGGRKKKKEEEGIRKVLPTNERNDIQDLFKICTGKRLFF